MEKERKSTKLKTYELDYNGLSPIWVPIPYVEIKEVENGD